MDETLGVARPAHRPLLQTALVALRNLHGRSATPREHRIVELTPGIYDILVFAYPLPLTAQHLRAVERLPHVTLVEISLSVAGITPGIFGALRVRLDLSAASSAKRSAAAAADDETDAEDSAAKRAASAKPSAAESAGALGWIARLFRDDD